MANYINFAKDRPLDLILLGRACIDLNPIPEEMYRSLDKSRTFKMYLGGSPANIAAGLGRLGKKCGFIAKVSNDQFGDFAINQLRGFGCDVSHVTKVSGPQNLGLTFTEVLSPEKSSILMYRQQIADLALDVSDVDEDYIKKGKALLISGTALSESPSREAALKAVMFAKRNGIPVFFDIDYRAYNWKNRDEMSIYYSAVAEKADLILGSREEFDLTMSLTKSGLDDPETASYFFGFDAKIVVIKHGKDGSTAYLRNGKKYDVKPYEVKPLKGFGGGDGYASAFIYGLFEGWDMSKMLQYGSASAAIQIKSHGCSDFMATLPELQAFILEEENKYGRHVESK
ncbi:MAG: 5-dehydro-2-deoxygluconokinase [Succinatimonas hippei]|nr:5-dehydro-2-deoxygluconokinase [Succinatimonas hippei]